MLRQMPHARGVVIDLRGNPGGPLPVAVTVTDRFQTTGDIVYVASRDEVHAHSAAGQRTYWADRPVVILVNGDTASAAELFAGALQQAERAELIGEPTGGKRFIQSVIPINEAGDLVLTTGYYAFTPIRQDAAGKPIIEFTGLVPLVPDTFVQLDAAQWQAVQSRWLTAALPDPTAIDISAILAADPQLQVAVARLKEHCTDE